MVSKEEFHMTNSCEKQYLITDFDELDSIICESLLSPRSSCESTSAQSSQQRKRKADCPSTTDFETSSDVEVSTDPNETSSSTDVEVPTDPKETGDSQRKIRYNKKKSALKKIERMLAVPNLIWSAGNTADESSIADIVNTYCTSDCEFVTTVLEAFRGREQLLKHALILSQSCPDFLHVFSNIRHCDMEVKFDFSCSGTILPELELYREPLRSFSAPLADKADQIVSRGKKCKFVVQGATSLLLTPDLDYFQRFVTEFHSSNIIESLVDVEDEIQTMK